jgi:hypothetical protein
MIEFMRGIRMPLGTASNRRVGEDLVEQAGVLPVRLPDQSARSPGPDPDFRSQG